MKKIFIGLTIIGIIAIIGLNIPETKANPSSVQINTNGSTTNSVSTTTAIYMTSSTATSSVAFDPENGNHLQLFASALSSTTPSVLFFNVQFSNDNIDWYTYQTIAAGGGTLTNGTNGDGFGWTAATTTVGQTVNKTFPVITSYAAKYGRIQYSLTGGAGNILVQIAQKKEF